MATTGSDYNKIMIAGCGLALLFLFLKGSKPGGKPGGNPSVSPVNIKLSGPNPAINYTLNGAPSNRAECVAAAKQNTAYVTITGDANHGEAEALKKDLKDAGAYVAYRDASATPVGWPTGT